MEQVLSGLHRKILLIYWDDVICISLDFVTHVSRLWELVNCLWTAGLNLKSSKCALLQPEVKYLGHVVYRNEVATKLEKVQVVEEWTVPHSWAC